MIPEKTSFDLRETIRAPFCRCPKCGKPSFGVLDVSSHSYTRRCRDCWHTSSPPISLPTLQKKIIYLDQCAVSELAKVEDPRLKQNQAYPLAPHWPELHRSLTLLVACQMIVCPESECHFLESLVHESGYEGFKALYEGLSAGVRFQPPQEIQTRQICRTLARWLGNTSRPEMTRQDAMCGKTDAWQELWRFSLNSNYTSFIPTLRKERDSLDDVFGRAFRQWRGDGGWKFEDWVKERIEGLRTSLLTSFRVVSNPLAGLMMDNSRGFGSNLISYDRDSIVRIVRELEEAQIPIDRRERTFREFLSSREFANIPTIKISAAMFAALARRAEMDRRSKPPKGGFDTDRVAVSAFLPYCDAMFLDKDCMALLVQNPVRDHIASKARLFSTSNAGEFSQYLHDIASTATPAHLCTVADVYGPHLVNQFGEIFWTDGAKDSLLGSVPSNGFMTSGHIDR